MGYSLGIDLGTTSVAAAVCDGATLEIVALGDRSARIPAAVYLRGSDGTLLVGEHAASRTVSSPTRVARDLKRRLGDPAPVLLGDRAYSVAALLGELLGQVVRTVADRYSEPPDRVVLTCPASWDAARRALLTDVAQRAGLTEPLLISEAEAAAAHHAAAEGLAEGHTLAVFDLGGGCFDAAVLRIGRDGPEVLGAPQGIEYLGGIDFDEALLRHVDGRTERSLSTLDGHNPRALPTIARARQDCRVAKETLSVDTRAVVPVQLQDRYAEVRIRRTEFEKLIREQLDATVAALTGAVQSAAEPAELLLAGGSTRIPLVTKLVSAAVPAPVRTSPTHGVALGAARLAWQSTRQAAPHATDPARPALVTASAPSTGGARHRLPEPPDQLDADQPPAVRAVRRPPELWAGALLLTLAILPVAILGLALIVRPTSIGLDIWRQFTDVDLIGDLGTLATVFRGIGVLLATLAASFTALAWLSALPRRGARTITTGLVVIEILALILIMTRLRPTPLSITMLVLAAAGIVLVYLPRVEQYRRYARQRDLRAQQQRSTS
ncbi:MAG TPA: Hsp70 family protein [Pseudonocardia sp.]|nr:Hsp70 family protein [Pseudonocardia sp.]